MGSAEDRLEASLVAALVAVGRAAAALAGLTAPATEPLGVDLAEGAGVATVRGK